jgi:hypothetical protein
VDINLNPALADYVRYECSKILKKFNVPAKKNITRDERTALFELRKREDIVILKSDKGNSPVNMDKDEYINKSEEILHTNSYKLKRSDPTNSIVIKLKEVFTSQKLNRFETRKLLPENSKTPRFFGLL